MDFCEDTEKDKVRDACETIFDSLHDYVRESYADITMLLDASDYFSDMQKTRRLQSYLTNLHLADKWGKERPSSRWMVDNSGFFHLYDTMTGLGMRFHAVDPLTRGLPKGDGSFSSRAMYTQGPNVVADTISANLLGYPDLKGINLVVACDYARLGEEVFMRVFKPMSPGRYGRKGASAYSFPVMHSDDSGITRLPDFEPGLDPSENVLDQLLVEEEMNEQKGK